MSFILAIHNVKEVLRTYYPREFEKFQRVSDPLWWLFCVSSLQRTTDELLEGNPPQGGLTIVVLVTGQRDEIPFAELLSSSDSTPVERMGYVCKSLVAVALKKHPLPPTDKQSTRYTLNKVGRSDVWDDATLRGYLDASEDSYLWRVLSSVLNVAISDKRERKATRKRLSKPLVYSAKNAFNNIGTVTDYINKSNAYTIYSNLHLRSRMNGDLSRVHQLILGEKQKLEVNLRGLISDDLTMRPLFQGRGYTVYSVLKDGAAQHFSLFFSVLGERSSSLFRSSSAERTQSTIHVHRGREEEHHIEGNLVWNGGRSRKTVNIVVFKTEPLVANLSMVLMEHYQTNPEEVQKYVSECFDVVFRAVYKTRWRHNNMKCDKLVATHRDPSQGGGLSWKIIDFQSEGENVNTTWLASRPSTHIGLPEIWDVVCLFVDVLRIKPVPGIVDVVSRFSYNLREYLTTIGVSSHSLMLSFLTRVLKNNRGGAAMTAKYNNELLVKIDKGAVVSEWKRIDEILEFLKGSVSVKASILASEGVDNVFSLVEMKENVFLDETYRICYNNNVDYLLIAFKRNDGGDERMLAHRFCVFKGIAVRVERMFYIETAGFAIISPIEEFAHNRFQRLLGSRTRTLEEMTKFLDAVFHCVKSLYTEGGCIHQNVTLDKLVLTRDGRVLFFNLRKAWHSMEFANGEVSSQNSVTYPFMIRDKEVITVFPQLLGVSIPFPVFDSVSLYLDILRIVKESSIGTALKDRMYKYMTEVAPKRYFNYGEPRSDVLSIERLVNDAWDVRIEMKSPFLVSSGHSLVSFSNRSTMNNRERVKVM